MPEKEYIISLDETTRIFVYFDTSLGTPTQFVVKLEIFINGDWVEIQRYDMYHGFVHKDVLNRKGEKIRQIPYYFADEKSGPNIAINDFKENYKIYMWRFYHE